MKSNKQRRKEIKRRRLLRARTYQQVDSCTEASAPIPGMVAADRNALAHNNTYSLLPLFYIDRPFICRDCGSAELWTAKQQKWWYEIAKGHIDSVAVRCRPCRKTLQNQKAEVRRIHLEGIARKVST